MELTFKDVGQGDSILLKWTDNDGLKIGIIDCNNYAGNNPILDELKSIDQSFIIEFIVVSHGHTDHYSGIFVLLEYCNSQNILIKNFTSTLHPVQFPYLEITLSRNQQLQIVELINLVNHLYENTKIIGSVYPAYDNMTQFKIGSYLLKCLYPRQLEYNKLEKRLSNFLNKKVKKKPNLNYISTIFAIIGNEQYALLTSDCPKHSLQFINSTYKELESKELQLAQVPHHGSKNNHNKQFWKGRKRMDECPALVSSGTSKHCLPDLIVVSDFAELNYKLYSTNYVHGIREYVEGTTVEIDQTYILDLVSVIVDSYSIKQNDRLRGDKCFKLESSKIVYTP